MERTLSVEMVLPPVLAVQITRYQLLDQHQKMTANMVNWELGSRMNDVRFQFLFATIKRSEMNDFLVYCCSYMIIISLFSYDFI